MRQTIEPHKLWSLLCRNVTGCIPPKESEIIFDVWHANWLHKKPRMLLEVGLMGNVQWQHNNANTTLKRIIVRRPIGLIRATKH